MCKQNKRILSFTFYALFLSFVTSSFAEEEKSPNHLEGTEKVNSEKLIQYVEGIPDLIIIDSRIKIDRQLGYIEGSYSLPDVETSCATLAKILPHKKSPAAFYCNGPKCGRSANAVKVAIKCGYTNTFWFRGGFEEWKKKKYPFVTN